MLTPHKRTAFTLIELLVVVGIIALIAGALIPAIGMIIRTSKEKASGQRMDAILGALATYNHHTGSSARELQRRLNLGGVMFMRFDKVINEVRRDGGGDPVGNVRSKHVGGGNGRYFPPPIFQAGEGGGEFYIPIVDAQNDNRRNKGSTGYIAIMRKLFEVHPPASGPIPRTWYEETWPYSWPLSDWDDTTIGDIPPILGWPWGSYGLNLLGNAVDPTLPATDIVDQFPTTHGWSSDHPRYTEPNGWSSRHLTVLNGWGVYGTMADNGNFQVTATIEDIASPHDAYYSERSDGSTIHVAGNERPPFDVGLMSPIKTIQFLQAAKTLPPGQAGADAYRTDRNPEKPWNDRYGHPIVVAYALFQPERFAFTIKRSDNEPFYRNHNIRDWWLDKCTVAFGHNRALYLVAGSPGQTLAPGIPRTWGAADDKEVLANLWRQIRDVTKAVEWNEQAWSASSKPWSGVRARNKGSFRSLIFEPRVVK